jgi:hypothetical protein
MDKGKDLGASLAEEILTEAATGFFTERRELDGQAAVLDAYVSRLAQKGEQIKKKAAELHYLLLEKQYVEVFYQDLGVDARVFSKISGRLFQDAPSLKIPFAFGLKKRYSHLVVMAYDRLRTALTAYLFGQDDLNDFKKCPEAPEPEPNYRMVMIMAELINEKIKKINEAKPPSSVLQFAKSLNPEMLEKEKITGAVSPNYEGVLNQTLGLSPIDTACLNVERYPELPDLNSARLTIFKFCEKLYPFHKAEIEKRILQMKALISSNKK